MIQETKSATELMAQLVRFYEHLKTIDAETIEWNKRPVADEWPMIELMCHLRDVEIDVHQARLDAILAQENAFLPGQDTDHWAIERNYAEQDGHAALIAFIAARETTLTQLASLKDEDWARTGRHSFLDTTSIFELMAMAVSHEQEHWLQIDALLN